MAVNDDDNDKTEEPVGDAWNEQLDRILLAPKPPPPQKEPSSLLSSPSRLRQGVQWLNQQPQHSLTRSNWDAIFTAIEQVTAAESYERMESVPLLNNKNNNSDGKTDSNTNGATLFPLVSTARSEMVELYDSLAQRGDLRLYGAVTTALPPAATAVPSSSSLSPPVLISPALLESILNRPMSALTPKPTNSFLVAGIVVAVAEALAAIATGISFNAIVLTTLALATLDRLFLNGAVLESFLQVFSPGIRDKIIRHEAGHFLAAYLLGCPVEGIVLSAWAALKDERFGNRAVSAGTSFFDPQLSQQINNSSSNNNNNRSQGGGGTAVSAGVSRASIDRYSIIVMAGIAAEADFYGQADGGASDELALVAFLSRLNGNMNGVAVWDGNAIRNQARYGALQATLMLRQYQPAYDAIVDTLQRGGRLGDCIYALEQAARKYNLPTQSERQPMGYIVTSADSTGRGVQQRWSPAEESNLQSDGGYVDPAERKRLMVANASKSSSTSIDDKDVVADDMDPSLPSVLAQQQTLQEYRIQVEKQLRDVQERLNQMESSSVTTTTTTGSTKSPS